MKKIVLPMLAAAALLAAPAAYARTMHDSDMSGSWRVLADANTDTCYTSNQRAASGETQVAGPFASQSQAASAMSAAIACGGYNNRN